MQSGVVGESQQLFSLLKFRPTIALYQAAGERSACLAAARSLPDGSRPNLAPTLLRNISAVHAVLEVGITERRVWKVSSARVVRSGIVRGSV